MSRRASPHELAAWSLQVSEEENRLAKELMNDAFERNRVQREDPGFKYDVRREFGEGSEDCGWDDDMDDSDEGGGEE